MEIRTVNDPAGYEDACALLHKAQNAETEATGVLFNTNKLRPEELKSQIESNNNNKCLGAYENARIIGTLCVFKGKKDRWFTGGRSCFEIKYVAVDPESQGKHIGSAMMDHVKSMEGYDILYVSTGENNKKAIRYYLKNGFILVDVSRGILNNAYRLAYWREGCPIKQSRINMHLCYSRIKCFIKKILIRPKVNKDVFR